MIRLTTMNIKSKDTLKRGSIRNSKKQDPIKLCAKLTAKLLETAYKLKVLAFKLNEDPPQHHIHFLTFMVSLKIIFSQYKESWEVLLDHQKIGG